jgi:hypothetical protein
MRRQYSSIQNLIWLTMPILALFVFSLLMYFTPTTNIFLSAVKIVSGVIALIFIPGFYIAEAFLDDDGGMTKFGFSLIFGIAFQTLIVLSLYSIGSLFLYNEIDFSLTLLVLTFLFTSLLFVLRTRVKWRLKNVVDETSISLKAKDFVIKNKFLIAVFVLSLAVRLCYQSFVGAPITDGALYIEMAKNLEATGQFTSKVIKDSWATQFFNGLGFNLHLLTYFDIAIFFSIGGIAFSSAKLMTVLVGSLVVFMIYKISKELFGRETAMIATLVASIHPLLLLYSCVLFGPEILGTLFMLTAFYFFLKSLRSNFSTSRRYAIFAGLFSGLTLETTNYIFWGFFIAILIPFLLVLVKEKINMRAKIVKFLAAFFLVGGVIVTTFLTADMYFTHPLSSFFWVTYSTIPVVFAVILFWKRNDRRLSNIYWMGIVTFVIYQFAMVRTYYLGQIIPRESVTQVVNPLPGVSLPVAILGIAFVQLQQLPVLLGSYSIFWETVVASSIEIIVFLACLSFIRLSKWKENLYMISLPLSLSMIMTLFALYPTIVHYWNYRLYISTTPFFIILSASTLWLLSKACSHIKIPQKNGASKMHAHRFVFAISLAIIIIFSAFFPLYVEWITPMEQTYERVLYWEPAFDWIKMNTSENAIIATINPREFAWYTNRSTVCPLGPGEGEAAYDISTSTLVDYITRFKVGYLVVDEAFHTEYIRLRYLYEKPSEAPYGFVQVFNHEDENGKLLIYDVRGISMPIGVVDLYPSDDSYTYGNGPNDNNGNVTWLYVGVDTSLSPLNTYLKFNLSRVPEGKRILDAKLRLYTRNVIVAGRGGSSTNLKILANYVADDNWNEMNLTYSNQPVFHPEIFNESQLEENYSFDEWLTWNVTRLVEKEYNEDRVLSIALQMDYLTLVATRVEFFSKESGYEPVLEVTFTVK